MNLKAAVRLLDRLVADELLPATERQRVLQIIETTGARAEEALLEARVMEEGRLLRYLAQLHQTRFVSTEKLARAAIDRLTLDAVPRALAERKTILPVLLDPKTKVLSVVTPDPDDAPALHEVQVSSGARSVCALVGRPSAIKAAIAKHYGGDVHAFSSLEVRPSQQPPAALVNRARVSLSERSPRSSLLPVSGGHRPPPSGDGKRARVLVSDSGPADARSSLRPGVGASPGELGFPPGPSGGRQYLAIIGALVSLLESSKPELGGHSASVAWLMRRLGERIGLSESERFFLTLCGHVHDVGKRRAYHLTALNVAEYDSHRAAAEQQYLGPLRLLEGLPREVAEAAAGMYERHDGRGFPDGLGGKDIPLGARLLALADTYTDLTQNPRNACQRTLTPAQACEAIGSYRGTVFEPALVDLLRKTVVADVLTVQLLGQDHRVLIVDGDPEEATLLGTRMLESGLETHPVHRSDLAFRALQDGEFDVVIAEMDLQPQDGLELLAQVRRTVWGKTLPWIVVTGRSSRTERDRALAAGASDYLSKPVPGDVVVARARHLAGQLLGNRAPRCVTGSLQEMSLPDILRVLGQGRRSGSLQVTATGSVGEIHVVEGNIYDAFWAHQRGEDAVREMLGLQEGEFSLGPGSDVPRRVVLASTEALLQDTRQRHRLDEQET